MGRRCSEVFSIINLRRSGEDHRAYHRRKRYRQGNGGHAPCTKAARTTLRAIPGDQLRRYSRNAHRIEALFRARGVAAFTSGRAAPQHGYFRDADGGTLLLDEVGETAAARCNDQAVALVLEEATVTPVGTTTPQKVDVRIVAATHRELEDEVRESKFRQDLFFRLNVVRVDLPPLRKRPEDLPLLTRYFLDEICRTNGFEPREIDPSLLEAFARFDWPGNVRELKNVLESLLDPQRQAYPVSRRSACPGCSREKIRANTEESSENGSALNDLNLTRLSKQMILKALEACHGNPDRGGQTAWHQPPYASPAAQRIWPPRLNWKM